MEFEPFIAPSALKHGISREDILHAYRNPIRIFELDENLYMIIGANQAAIILEVGVSINSNRQIIIHAMNARSRFL
ncbi:MAG: hypothetical protein JHD08_06130 [Candidatus Nanopelagicales bacterium]|nr:hypothetical protein [Candidatus Nanopelagicales bacterium]MBJ7394261.1 hypothetical protein [Candidatus Nanopelagicales bacterium]